MMKYILIWQIAGYSAMGGGTYFDMFTTLEEMDSKVDSLLKESGTDFSIHLAGELRNTFNYKPIEIIKKLGRE